MSFLPCLHKNYKVVQNIILSRTKVFEEYTVRHKWLSKIYFNAYYAYVKREIKLAKINEKTRVLHVGGGFPYTAAVIVRLTGADVVIFERDPETKNMACEWIRENGLQEKIKVVLANGANTHVSGFDVIIVSLSVTPKKKVLANIYGSCDKGTKIIYRSARKSFEAVYEDKEVLTMYGQYIKQTAYHFGIFLNASHLIIKGK